MKLQEVSYVEYDKKTDQLRVSLDDFYLDYIEPSGIIVERRDDTVGETSFTKQRDSNLFDRDRKGLTKEAYVIADASMEIDHDAGDGLYGQYEAVYSDLSDNFSKRMNPSK